MTRSIQTIIVEPARLVRESLRHLLCDNDFDVVLDVASLSEAICKLQVCSPELILISSAAVRPAPEDVHSLKRPSNKLVLLADDLTKQDSGIIRWVNLAGCLSTNSSADGFIYSLKAILAGEVVIGREVLAQIGRPTQDLTTQDPATLVERIQAQREQSGGPPGGFHELDPSDIQLLSLIMSGKSTKNIASCLGISKDAVMAQLRILMRQMGVQTRVQAALWIARSGLLQDDPSIGA
ncbi:LuxR C-terminal-related transcriptional regulator (plasmid) [Skermanella rosea]|uniref:helix-turn-helix transcriptional regulator n=1 Tax=Skermanella rosea TaxID=1817965 RepID=UPI0019329848|nr:LuxR C-terminal-related transcriptional regulator [Skermanella rosea]UEM07346.1 LuxR C-terminal-related transcriptional regulator [Skermanella rosea]